MPRYPHYLRPCKGQSQPRSVLCVALEGTLGKGGVWAWSHLERIGHPDGYQKLLYGSDAATFWASLRSHLVTHRLTWMVMLPACQTLADLGLWELLEEDAWGLEKRNAKASKVPAEPEHNASKRLAVLEDPPTVLQIRPRNGRGAAKIIDARNYGVGGWADIVAGELFPGDAERTAKAKAVDLRNWFAEWMDTVATNNLGSLKATAASQAMHAYRVSYLRSPVLIHADAATLGLERQAVYAGRNECWRTGLITGPVYHLDFNSHYPACAAGKQMPARWKYSWHGLERDPVQMMRSGWCIIAEVTLETPLNDYPVRFSWNRHNRGYLAGFAKSAPGRPRDGDIVYPVGTFNTVLCGPELFLAWSRGHIKRWWNCAAYEPSELFTKWTHDLHQMELAAKRDGSVGAAKCIKRIRNSLFGKFNQWSWRWEDVPTGAAPMPFGVWFENERESGETVRYRSIAWNVQREHMLGEPDESAPAISAWVYSLARVKLLSAIEYAGRDNVYYMDADSIWCNQKGYHRLREGNWLDQEKLGCLKEKEACEWVRFTGLKSYETPRAVVQAGLPIDSPGNPTDGWLFTSPERVMPALMRGRMPGQRMIETVVKTSGHYRHGIVTVGGKVLPFTFGEE